MNIVIGRWEKARRRKKNSLKILSNIFSLTTEQSAEGVSRDQRAREIENLFRLIYVYGRFMGINNLMLF